MKNYDLLKVVASKLDGLQYPLREVHLKELREYCKENRIVMCFGSSDDLLELDGAIYDEYGCWNGGSICFDEKGERADANVYYPVTAVWCKDDISWQYEFEPKHEIFTIYEDANIYCKGIVFFVDDLKRNSSVCNDELEKQLKEVAMGMSQDEYLEFVYKPLMEANGEKMRADIERAKEEHPEIVKACEENANKVLSLFQKDCDKRIMELKAENERLKRELKEKCFDKLTLPKPTKTNCEG